MSPPAAAAAADVCFLSSFQAYRPYTMTPAMFAPHNDISCRRRDGPKRIGGRPRRCLSIRQTARNVQSHKQFGFHTFLALVPQKTSSYSSDITKFCITNCKGTTPTLPPYVSIATLSGHVENVRVTG